MIRHSTPHWRSLRHTLGLLLLTLGAALASGAQALELAALNAAISGLLQSDARLGKALVSREEVLRFYQRREYRAAWYAEYGPDLQREELIEALRNAPLDGLTPSDYHLPRLQEALERKSQDPSAVARLDILLTDAFLSFASALRSGRVDPHTVDPEWDIRTNRYHMSEVLEYALDHAAVVEVLRDMPPFQQGYYDLRDALARYQAIADAGGWPLVALGETLRPGERDPRVPQLRARLLAGGELPSVQLMEGEESLFDPMLADALKRFQHNHGLVADGVLGRGTLLALNVPVEERVRTLRVNLERWRWLPRGYLDRYLLVNLTDFTLDVYEEGRSVLKMNVIVGRRDRQTPVLSSQIDALVLNPNWYVPRSIFRRDILPELQKDPDYLKRKSINLVAHDGSGERSSTDIDWSQVNPRDFPYTLRQDPGESNALGVVKFTFPNRHEVYLHDTPTKTLFAKPVRAFSSGCVRLEEPLKLVEYLLRDEPDWDMSRAEAQLKAGGNRRVSLSRPLPVFLFYWTAWVDEDGQVQFRDDIYGRDRRLIEVLGRRDGQAVALSSR